MDRYRAASTSSRFARRRPVGRSSRSARSDATRRSLAQSAAPAALARAREPADRGRWPRVAPPDIAPAALPRVHPVPPWRRRASRLREQGGGIRLLFVKEQVHACSPLGELNTVKLQLLHVLRR